MRALFFGTPEIAVPALEALHEIAEVVGVVCQPDRPAGRGMTLRPPPVKVAAEKLGLAVHQPKKIKHPPLAGWVAERNVDVAVVMAYGRILPQAVLDAPRRGCMNLHASLLPRYRGAAPINWAIARGETETGICLMQMDAGMDTGPVLSVHRITIGSEETAGELADRLAALGATVIRQDLARAVGGQLSPLPQDESNATHAPMLAKRDGLIDWSLPVEKVHAHVRGMTPWPGAFTHTRGTTLKVHACSVHGGEADAVPGTIVLADPTCVLVACGQGLLELVSLQVPGKKAMPAGNMVLGRTVRPGDRLGTDET
ncbi:MAG: methionyl-tRNA formyltransferase [Coriobacteriia bacterium]